MSLPLTAAASSDTCHTVWVSAPAFLSICAQRRGAAVDGDAVDDRRDDGRRANLVRRALHDVTAEDRDVAICADGLSARAIPSATANSEPGPSSRTSRVSPSCADSMRRLRDVGREADRFAGDGDEQLAGHLGGAYLRRTSPARRTSRPGGVTESPKATLRASPDPTFDAEYDRGEWQLGGSKHAFLLGAAGAIPVTSRERPSRSPSTGGLGSSSLGGPPISPPPTAKPLDPSTILVDHPTVLLALGASAFVVFRALLFSDFKVPAAITVLAKGGLEGVLLSSAAALVPLFAPGVALLAGIGLYRGTAGRAPWQRVALWTALLFAIWICVVAVPILTVATIVGLAGWSYSAVRDQSSSTFFLATLVFAIIAMAATLSPWLPTERITIGSQTYTGYVLEETSNWTTILRPGGRIVIVDSGDVGDRAVCLPAPAGTLPLTTLVGATGLLFERLGIGEPADPVPVCPPD